MKKIFLITFLSFFISSVLYSQSKLPECKSTDKVLYHNCYGKKFYGRSGEYYEAEFKNNLPIGEVKYSTGDKIEDVVSWKFELLRNRVKTKHNETFWVGANSENRDGIEHFQYKKIIHTRHPFTANFHTLCHEGIITLDHLIKKDVNGKVVEKGPLFKINEANLELLFPPPIIFNLS